MKIECCLLYPAQLLHVVFEIRARTKESPSRHQTMIFPIYHDERSFHSYLLWEGGGKKACNHLKGLPPGFFPLCRRIDTGTDGLYLHMDLLPLLHALTIYSVDKGGPLQINILNVLLSTMTKLSRKGEITVCSQK